MKLSMQQRDALLAGLLLLKDAITNEQTAGFDSSDPESHRLADILTNGGVHSGLNLEQCVTLADMIVDNYPDPPVSAEGQGSAETQPDLEPQAHQPKTITVVAEAYATNEHRAAPSFGVFEVTQASLDRLRSLADMASKHSLSEVRVHGYPDWGPGDIDNDLRLQSPELVIVPRGAFWFTDYPKHSSYTIETRSCEIDHLQSLFDKASDAEVIFMTEKEGVLERYEEEDYEPPILASQHS